MTNREVKEKIKNEYKDLKDFQRATVEYVFKKLYKEKHKKHLIADEVGLGKTIVAKGLIIKAMERHLNSSRRNKPFKVVYICSNQALTGQNLKKLNILRSDDFEKPDSGRLLFQAYKPKKKDNLDLSSLTPSTSFRLTKGTGIAEERKLIWLILSRFGIYKRGKRRNGLKLALMGNVEKPSSWKKELNEYENEKKRDIRTGLPRKFKKTVKETIIDLSNKYYSEVKKDTNFTGKVSLQKLLLFYSLKLRNDNVKKYKGPVFLIGILRKILTEICLDYMNADLFILDEFQKFKDLIDTNEEVMSEAAIIANKIFHINGAKVLMLSATPFKPFTTAIDDEFNENHYKEFKTVLSFLFNDDKEKLELFEKYRKEFFEILRRPEKIENCSKESKKFLEDLYRQVISRTERLLVSDDNNTLLKNMLQDPLELCAEDILNFIKSDKIIQELDAKSKNGARNIIDYSKSAPFPLSFLDGYKLKDDLKEKKSNELIKKNIRTNKIAWFDMRKVQKYKELGKLPNSKFRFLLDECLNNGMWKQLWISPSIPYYPLDGSFKDSHLNSKILIFSKWKMVPRAISSIVSYESERLTIGDKRIGDSDNKVYTPPFINGSKKKRQPRKPTKILALNTKAGKPQKMSAFSILYPSLTLASLYDIQSNIREQKSKSLKDLKKDIALIIKEKINEAGLAKYCSSKRKTKNWYWVAPLLLDKFYFRQDFNNWLNEDGFWATYFYSGQDKENDDEKYNHSLSAEIHFEELKQVFNNPENYNLGQFPKDLFEVLAQKVIGSPAICSIRLLTKIFPNEKSINILNNSLDIANSFHSMFDKPESISIVLLNTLDKNKRRKIRDTNYWNDVLNYCTDGNLQSVLDEFGHLINSDFKDIEEFGDRIIDSVSTRTSSLKVDSAEDFLNNKQTTMRCHYAVDFGNQNLDKEEGRKRVKSILENFNSPFRPFVLASTSIGQEGLDFHYYCRKVMHWNLPTNPVDLEQREGRVNRYKGLVIRQNIVKKYRKVLTKTNSDLWETLFNHALKVEGKSKRKCELVPYWHVEGNYINIERIIPLISYSKDVEHLNNLLKALTLYRLTFGQPRQEELVNSLYNDIDKKKLEKVRKELMINLSPITYKKNSK